ncbi:MAG: hypothetical protein EOO61_03065 [Hymenobacter sp.]|nr:MAG: hypothetical protein EOO61_03065 [Hymenobacter sp.]
MVPVDMTNGAKMQAVSAGTSTISKQGTFISGGTWYDRYWCDGAAGTVMTVYEFDTCRDELPGPGFGPLLFFKHPTTQVVTFSSAQRPFIVVGELSGNSGGFSMAGRTLAGVFTSFGGYQAIEYWSGPVQDNSTRPVRDVYTGDYTNRVYGCSIFGSSASIAQIPITNGQEVVYTTRGGARPSPSVNFDVTQGLITIIDVSGI